MSFCTAKETIKNEKTTTEWKTTFANRNLKWGYYKNI